MFFSHQIICSLTIEIRVESGKQYIVVDEFNVENPKTKNNIYKYE